MLLSMTGFGRGTNSLGDKTITIEVRSLNSKFTDIRFKCPSTYREKEPVMRKRITTFAERGKLDVTIDVKSLTGDDDFGLNVPLYKKYYTELSKIHEEMGVPAGDLTQAILRIQNVVASPDSRMTKEEWEAVQKTLDDALAHFDTFRKSEGKAMEVDLRGRIANIGEALAKVDPHETGRIDKLKARLRQNLEDFLGKDNVDENRFEQEIIFYLEKIDINEEKQRLGQHLIYFIEQLDGKDTLKGRKLSFISQEMGREINTLGAKAYSSDIQKLVVFMKDELEKIKEQVANAV
ncbi:MAG: hypothetical protein ACI9XO_000198 [Paraglaciecola sp.]|jgi:uncharacterized protein (TIGR00255 family)